jgi:hypothetical protein
MHPIFRSMIAPVLALAFSAGVAMAGVPQGAQQAYDTGEFDKAVALAQAEGTGEALAFAARAAVAQAVSPEVGLCAVCVQNAEALARAAVAQDAQFADGYVQLAIALGLRGRLIGLMSARSEEIPEKARAAVDTALKLDPNDVWAQATLGAWNLEIVHRAGAILADLTYGATEEDGLKYFRAAVKADPTRLVVNFQFALSMLAVDADRFRVEAAAALDAGAKDTRQDALTKLMRGRLVKLRALLSTGSTSDIDSLVKRYQGYPVDAL